MKADQLTDRQREILDFIRSCDIPPTVREIGRAMGISSPNGIQSQLKSLVQKGAITVEPNTARGIRVVGKSKLIQCPHCGQSFVAKGNQG